MIYKATIKIKQKLVDNLQFYPFVKFTSIFQLMSRNLVPFQAINRKNTFNIFQDQNQPHNHSLKLNYNNKQQSQNQQYPKHQEKPLTTYKIIEESKQYEDLKWGYLSKFFSKATRATHIFHCKQQTLFDAYSLADKTISLLTEDKLTFEYWTLCCIFLAMKFEQIYPPRLKQLQIIFKNYVRVGEYNRCELLILQKIDFDMNFININTLSSQVIHELKTNEERIFFYYLLELGLSCRSELKNYTLKQIVYSVAYILASRSLFLGPKEFIGGISVARIEDCSKRLIVIQTYATSRSPIVHKKYNDKKKNHVSIKSLPNFLSMTRFVLNRHSNPIEQISRVIPFIKINNSKNQPIDQQYY